MNPRRKKFAASIATFLLVALLVLATPLGAQPTITTCTSGLFGADMVLRDGNPHDGFIAAGSVVKHISSVSPGSGSCTFGPLLPDIALGAVASWGVTLDNDGNLYVAVGSNLAAITTILQIAPPYTGTPTVFYSGGTSLRSLARHGNIFYAADYFAGKILRFDLKIGPSSVTTFAVTDVFGLWAAGVDDLFVTSNNFGEVTHVTSTGISTVATGLSLPEGIGSDDVNLYIAAGGVIFTVPVTGGVPSFYAGSPIMFSHGVTVWKGVGYVTDSQSPPQVNKFTLLP